MQEVQIPYELLIRWTKEGELSGAHVAWRRAVMVNGEVVALSEPEPPVPLQEATDEMRAVMGDLYPHALASALEKIAELEDTIRNTAESLRRQTAAAQSKASVQ